MLQKLFKNSVDKILKDTISESAFPEIKEKLDDVRYDYGEGGLISGYDIIGFLRDNTELSSNELDVLEKKLRDLATEYGKTGIISVHLLTGDYWEKEKPKVTHKEFYEFFNDYTTSYGYYGSNFGQNYEGENKEYLSFMADEIFNFYSGSLEEIAEKEIISEISYMMRTEGTTYLLISFDDDGLVEIELHRDLSGDTYGDDTSLKVMHVSIPSKSKTELLSSDEIQMLEELGYTRFKPDSE